MFSAFERMVAMRFVRPRRGQGFISLVAAFSLLGITLGVATLIIVMSVMNGFREELLGRILGLNGHMSISSQSGPMTNFDALADKLRSLPHVVSVTPAVEGQVMVTAAGQAEGALVRGVRQEDLRKRAIVAGNIKAGSLDDFTGKDVIAIGRDMARHFGLTIGSQLTLISPQVTTTIMGAVPRMKTYKVVAIFEVGMYEYDSSFIFMPLEAAQLFFKKPDAVSNLEIMVDDPDRVDQVGYAVITQAGGNYNLTDWQKANSTFFGAIQVERNVMFIILLLIIIVAAFNIVSGQVMLVKEKGRGIAILRTMGATRGTISRIFLLSGTSIGFVGTALGFILGLAFSLNIETIRGWVEYVLHAKLFPPEVYFLTQLPASVDAGEVAAVVGAALVISMLATLYPAWRAARLDPVEALRYE